MPGKRNRKSKATLPGGDRSLSMLDDSSSFSSDILDRTSRLNDDDNLSLYSNSSRRTADDILLQTDNHNDESPSRLIQLLDTYLEQLSEKSSKSRSQTRINVLKGMLHSLRKDYSTEELNTEWNSSINSLVDILARIVRQNVKDEEAILALQSMSVLCVQLCDPQRVTNFLTSGWQDMLLNIIRDSAATTPGVRSAAIHTLATLHFTSDYENHNELMQCMRVVESIYQPLFSSGNKANHSGLEHQLLQRAAVENWALLYCFLPPNMAETEGRARLILMQTLLHHPDVDSRLRMSAGQSLALICERLKQRDPTGGTIASSLAGIDKMQQPEEARECYTKLMTRLKTLANVSDKSLSKELKRDMRACFRSVRESIDQNLGAAFGTERENRPLTVDEYGLEMAIDSEGDDDSNPEEDASEEWLSTTPAAHLRWHDGRAQILKLGVIKLPLTRETIWLQRWSHKRFYDSLSDTLKGALPQHMQYNQMVRQMFDLSDPPVNFATAGFSNNNLESSKNVPTEAKQSKHLRRRMLESERKGNQLQRYKDRQIRERRLGQQSSFSED